MFGMLENPQIIIKLNTLYLHTNFITTLYLCYFQFGLLRYSAALICICLPTKAAIKYQAIHHTISSTFRNILRLVTEKEFTSYL